MRVLRKIALLAVAVSTLPSAGIAADAAFEQVTENLRPRYVVGDIMPRYSLEERMAEYGVPGVAIGIIRNGKLVHAQGYGVLQAGGQDQVNADTLFSVGSVSKVATAALLLKMHADGMVDIDKPVNDYLKTWHLPPHPSGVDVTLRMILSHTAGFNIHGFGDFLPGEDLPTVYDTLNGSAPAKHAPLTALFEPSVRYKYSGGGYTLAQLVATDIAGASFPDTVDQRLFSPLGMERSDFTNPLPTSTGNVAKAHNRRGEPTALPRGYEAMPEMGASGFWTSANELGAMVATLIRSYQQEGEYLPQNLVVDMMTKVAPSKHGLGPRLEGMGWDRFFHHGGANNSYRAWIEGHLATGDGLVVLTNGTRGNDLFLEIRNAAADTLGWNINPPVFLPEIALDETVLQSYAGAYEPLDSFPMTHREQLIGWIYDRPLTVAYEDGQLGLTVPGWDRSLELIPTAPNRFLIKGLDQRIGVAELVFHRDSKKAVPQMTLEMTGARSVYERTSAE